MSFRSNVVSIKCHFNQVSFRSCVVLIKFCFDQVSFRSNVVQSAVVRSRVIRSTVLAPSRRYWDFNNLQSFFVLMECNLTNEELISKTPYIHFGYF